MAANHKEAGMLIAALFLARDIAHREHLKVEGPGSYARHIALGDFYEGIVDLADELCETYQGCFDCILEIPLAAHEGNPDILETLTGQRDWIRQARYEAIPREETPLQNVIDEVELLYFRTIYKLSRLA